MNETELNELVSVACGLPVKDTSLAIMALVHVFTTYMQQGKSVCIPGIGSFAVKKAAPLARGNSPARAAVAADAARSVEFAPSVQLKSAIEVFRPSDEGPQEDR